jgi:DNA polymerase
MLELLTDQIGQCKLCNLYFGGRCKPWFTKKSRFVIVGEAPGRQEVVENTPFIGMAGNWLWSTIKLVTGYDRQDFAVINSVNCRPTDPDGRRNLKPQVEHMSQCKKWVRKFIKVMEPEKLLILGNYAMNSILGRPSGILKVNSSDGRFMNDEFLKGLPYVVSVHPAYCIYNSEEGPGLLKESISKFQIIKKKPMFDAIEDELWEI